MIFDKDDYIFQIDKYRLDFMEQEKMKLLFMKRKFEQLGFANSISDIPPSDYFEFDGGGQVSKIDILHTLNAI